MKKRPILAIAIAAGLTLTSAAAPAYASPSKHKENHHEQRGEKSIASYINVDKIYKDIELLSKLPREAGTEQEAKAAQYIKKKFESYGYKTEMQEFTFFGYSNPDKVELTIPGFELKPSAFTYSVNGNVTGSLVNAGTGTKESLANLDLTGKIALIQRGGITFGEKVLNAAEKGAEGVIIYNNQEGTMNGTLGDYTEDSIPSVSISQAEGESLVQALASGETLEASLVVEGAEAGERTSQNVIATKPPTNKKTKGKQDTEIVAIGAHHDSVQVAPGANDNASGTAVTLELARILKNVPTKTELRFITFGAEENGLLGSEHYVSTLTEDEKDRWTGYFNLDMVGSRDAGDLVLNTVDGNTNLLTQLSQSASLRLNGLATPIEAGGSSDHVSFFDAGIPSISFIHRPLEPWYHSPEDTIDKISKEKLLDVASIVSTAVYDYTKDEHKQKKKKKGKGHKGHHSKQNHR